jgi:uncharacterized protein with PIN domain
VSARIQYRSTLKIDRFLWLTIPIFFLIVIGGASRAEGIIDRPLSSQTHWFVDMNRFALSSHAGFKCEDCHGDMIENGQAHPDNQKPDFLKRSATRSFDYSRCQKCHKISYQRYLKGEHAKALTKEIRETDSNQPDPGVNEKTPAPTCGDCHSSHYDRSGLNRVDVGKRMVKRCGQCHKTQALSYMENIHGRVGVDLNNPSSAFCTDCHQAHSMTSLKDPKTALPACRRCHPTAETEFSNVVIHASIANLTTDDSPKHRSILWIHRIKIFMIAVVALSLVFFFGHSLLWLLRELHEKLRKH